MVDGSTVPSWIFLSYREAESEWYVNVEPDEDAEVGEYEVYLVTSLASDDYQVDLEPRKDVFNITLKEFPTTLTNQLPQPIFMPYDTEMPIGEITRFDLTPFDPDGDDVTHSFEFLTSETRSMCPECFHYDAAKNILRVEA